jgi:DNA repair exonuclease SbcCD ATPase subunit
MTTALTPETTFRDVSRRSANGRSKLSQTVHGDSVERGTAPRRSRRPGPVRFGLALEGNRGAVTTFSSKGAAVFERTRTGLREMPSNAVWLLSRIVTPAESVGGAAAGVRDKGRKVTAAVLDAAPVGDSVEIRARRAREASERARDAEERAVEASRESKALADRARRVSEAGRARVKEIERDTNREVKQRIEEAQKAADDLVRRERAAAEADAEEQLQEVEDDVENEIAEAEADAEESQRRAEDLVEDAAEALAEARRLADEAAEAAHAAAEEANQQAQQLQDEAKQRANDAEARVQAVEQLRTQTTATAKQTARVLESEAPDGLDARRKPELVELAASIGIENSAGMTKGELVEVITKAARQRARQGAHS